MQFFDQTAQFVIEQIPWQQQPYLGACRFKFVGFDADEFKTIAKLRNACNVSLALPPKFFYFVTQYSGGYGVRGPTTSRMSSSCRSIRSPNVRTFRTTRSILRSISSAHSSPSLRRRNVSAT